MCCRGVHRSAAVLTGVPPVALAKPMMAAVSCSAPASAAAAAAAADCLPAEPPSETRLHAAALAAYCSPRPLPALTDHCCHEPAPLLVARLAAAATAQGDGKQAKLGVDCPGSGARAAVSGRWHAICPLRLLALHGDPT